MIEVPLKWLQIRQEGNHLTFRMFSGQDVPTYTHAQDAQSFTAHVSGERCIAVFCHVTESTARVKSRSG